MVNLFWPVRLLTASGIAFTFGVVLAAMTALAGGPWVPVGVGVTGLVLLLLSPHVVAPEGALLRTIRWAVPTAEEMKRGDNNRSWPG